MDSNSKCYRHEIMGEAPPIRLFSISSKPNHSEDSTLEDIVDEIKKTPILEPIKIPTYEELFD